MHRTMIKAIISMVIAAALFYPAYSFANPGKRLVTINGLNYTDVDFENWWKHWNDKSDLVFPSNPDGFIEFQLMVQQGQEMGYDSKPSYLHKLDVFLQVRAMMALKYEEVESKIKITDDDLKRYFGENYSTIWVLQILAFDSEIKAQKAYEAMLPFKGQVAGRLVFADLYGAGPDEKADTYDEVKVTAADFHKNKKDAWLSIVKDMELGQVSSPFLNDDNKKYILLRLVDIKAADQSAFEDKRKKITEILYKEKSNQLTVDLIESLKKKYNVQVDRKTLADVKLDGNNSKELLDAKILTMDGFEATVNDLVYNAMKEKKLRKDVPDEQLKEMVLNSIISQTLVNRESLARGYEKRPPLQATYEFYKQNRLRAEVESGLMSEITIDEQDIKNFYDTNIASYTVPDKYTYILLKGDEAVLKKLWIGTVQGDDLNDLALKYSLDLQNLSQDAGSVPPDVIVELKKLEKGGVSVPFQLDGSYALVKLREHLPGQVLPLLQVKSMISEQLKKEGFERKKTEYINKLRSRSKIDINKSVWNDLKRELGNEN